MYANFAGQLFRLGRSASVGFVNQPLSAASRMIAESDMVTTSTITFPLSSSALSSEAVVAAFWRLNTRLMPYFSVNALMSPGIAGGGTPTYHVSVPSAFAALISAWEGPVAAAAEVAAVAVGAVPAPGATDPPHAAIASAALLDRPSLIASRLVRARP